MRIFAAKITNRGRIDVSGRGFRGGTATVISACVAPNFDNKGNPGESVDDGTSGMPSTSSAANRGGGGGGCGVGGHNGSAGGGGGGYGTMGQHGAPNTNNGAKPDLSGRGGVIYGTAQVVDVLMGSGGGSGHGLANGVCACDMWCIVYI